jgi:hypothetical protein
VTCATINNISKKFMANENKREYLSSVLSKIKLRSAGEKIKKFTGIPVSETSSSRMRYPSFYLNANQCPELKNKDVSEEITMVVKGKITSHSLNQSIQGESRENWDIEVQKIGLVNKNK